MFSKIKENMSLLLGGMLALAFTFLTTLKTFAAGPSTTTVASMFDGFVTTLWDYVSTILPVVAPVAIGFAILYGLYHWILRKGHGA